MISTIVVIGTIRARNAATYSSSDRRTNEPKNSKLTGASGFARFVPIDGITTDTASIAEKNAKPPRTASGSGGIPPFAWPTAIVKITKVAPIRIDAFWSAIWLRLRCIVCAVRRTWM